ncbi:MAG: hypothetical protein KatS3mg097_484 [Candidatus Parcubacteria bacterium]|nr:MAG: hypothetical protein KatS3mg097_484 [Candidatus Parcubacteria bacterium]
MIGWELPPFNSGGLGVACFYLAKELSQLVEDLTFTLPIKLNITSPPFKVLFAIPSNNNQSKPKRLESYFHKNFYFNSQILDLIFGYHKRILLNYKTKPTIVHGHDWFTAPAVYSLSKHYRTPSLVHVHSTEIERTNENPNQFIFDIEKKYFQKVDYLLPVSDLTKNVLIDDYKIKPEKIFVVPNGFFWSENKGEMPNYLAELKKDGWKIVLFVGRLTIQKGPDYLIRAIPMIINKQPKTKFVFVGSGDMFPQLVKLAYELKVEKYISFANFLREEKLWGVYQNADVLVMPSVNDPFGLVPLEALNNNLAPVISKTTGMGYYLNNILRFDFWDIKEMANKILGILNYETLKKTYLNNCKAEAQKKFCWQKTANQINNIYYKIIK